MESIWWSHLSCAQTHNQISNKSIFCFSAAVTHHNTPAILLSKLAPGDDKNNISHMSQAIYTSS